MKSVAIAYDEALAGRGACRVRETAQPAGELAWQARWFSGACGRQFTSTDGVPVIVTDFGEWNREAGPDFVRCTVQIDGETKRGAVEVDLEASGWEQHRHATNPDYDNTVLHILVHRPARRHFSRTASNRNVPQICLADHAAAAPEWESLAPARPGRCCAPLRDLSAAKLTDLLAVAAERRIRQKGAELDSMIRARGADAVLYEAVALALGYKSNKLPFRLLAQRVPPRKAASANGEALLFGLAGFLERPAPSASDARAHTAALWESWWRQRSAHAALMLPRHLWKMTGLRPANHPLRRLGALVCIAREWPAVRRALESGSEAALQKVLGDLEHPFWSFHTTWQSRRRTSPLALLGAGRIRDIFANVSIPLAHAREGGEDWLKVAAATPNATLRTVCARLFGGPMPHTLPRRLFVHQGLLQIHADFCLRDQGECSRCRFPSLVQSVST